MMDAKKLYEVYDELVCIQEKLLTYVNRLKIVQDKIHADAEILIELIIKNGGEFYDEIAYHWNDMGDYVNDQQELIGDVFQNTMMLNDLLLAKLEENRKEIFSK